MVSGIKKENSREISKENGVRVIVVIWSKSSLWEFTFIINFR